MGLRITIELKEIDPPSGRVRLEPTDPVAVDDRGFCGWLELLLVIQTLASQQAQGPQLADDEGPGPTD